MTQKHILSKYTFTYGCQCPKRLYLHKFKPELCNEEEEQQQAIFQSGINVGILAQQLFEGGVDASPPDPFSYQQSVADTQDYLKTHDVIYEAAFQFDGVMCAVDILVREGKKWHAYEVKSTNSVKPQHQLDAALQYYVLKNSGLPLSDFSVITFNSDYVRVGPIDVQELFMATSVQDYCEEETAFIQTKIDELKNMLAKKIEPIIEPGEFCFKPYECNFTQHCWKGVEPELEELDATDIPSINKKALKEFVKQVKYPLYYFDFETVMYGVPEFDYSSPYQQIPFQFSLHVQQSADSEVEHHAFLGDGVNDPREQLIKSMLELLGNSGSIFGWWISFEKGRIKELARNFPKYEKELLAINERMVDLIKPFKAQVFYHPGFNGSSSLKKVLPIIVPELSYSALAIQEGGTASFVYGQLKNMEIQTAEEHKNNLLEYCKLDTFAMVKIFEKVKSVVV
jgi:hypothetical protein